MSALNRYSTLQFIDMKFTQGFFIFWIIFQPISIEGQIPTSPPEFLAPLENHTVPQGRDIAFTCVVNSLHDYKVAWIKSDSKAILAIHTHMVAQNPRLEVTHNGHNAWRLKVHNVQRSDAGTYMCQINTDPMRSQMGILNVVIPPDILPDNDSAESSSMSTEGGNIRLKCKAAGIPEPTVSWKREDGRNIILRPEIGKEKIASSIDGEVLALTNVHRTDMGVYLCIAKNGVPPRVSKRFDVVVHFYPLVTVTNQLLASPIARNVELQCRVEASPKAMNHWMRDSGEKIIPSDKYFMEEQPLNEYSLEMKLTIRNIERKDIGGYVCTSANALGKAEGTVRLQEMDLPLETTTTTSTPRYIVTKARSKSITKMSKPRGGKTIKNQNDDKKEPKSASNPFIISSDTKLYSPSFKISTTTTLKPSVISSQRNNAANLRNFYNTFIYIFIEYIFI